MVSVDHIAFMSLFTLICFHFVVERDATFRAICIRVFGLRASLWLRKISDCEIFSMCTWMVPRSVERLNYFCEEEEYLKLQMYLRDDRFTALEGNTDHRSQLHKTILDMLHCPMRTNEKVLTLLYEQVLQGSHKGQASQVLNELTPIIRRLGS